MEILKISYLFLFTIVVIMVLTTMAHWLYRAINKDVKNDKRGCYLSRLSYNAKKVKHKHNHIL
jgi:hypothetical protein